MFEPLNKRHAISEAAFFFEFEKIPQAVLSLMLDAYPKVAELLPRNQPLPGMVIEQSEAAFTMNQVNGAEWSRIKPDGEPEWMVRITPNSVSIHCMEYSRWTDVWPYAYGILQHVFGAVPTSFISPANVGLRYVDRFDFKGDLNSYNASELFRADSRYIAPHVFDHGARWHSYTGWFEKCEELQMELLQQLNVDAVEQIGTRLPVVSIMHASLLRSQRPGELDKFLQLTHISESPVAKLMNVAHMGNHKLLRELLTDDMLKRIDLGLGDK